jgi:oxidoreductase
VAFSFGAQLNNKCVCRSKGLTEQGLASLGYSETIIFRPGLLTGVARPEPRIAETIGSAITGALSFISDGLEIKVRGLQNQPFLI